MKYCNKCGNKLESSAKFCNKCGNKIIKNEVEISSNNTKDLSNEELSKNNDINIKSNLDTNSNNIINKNKINIDESKYSKSKINESQKSDSNDLDKTTLYDKNDYDLNNNINNSSKETINKNTNNIINNNKIDEESYSYDDQIKPKNKKKKYIIISIIIIVILSIGSFIYFSRDSLMYNHYVNKADSATSTFEKLKDYNNALEYRYNDDVINSIYNVLKGDSSFIDEMSPLTNLNKEDTNKLIYKLCTFYADKNFDGKNYDACLSYLSLAKKYGYNEKDYINYNELMKKIDESKENHKSTDSSQNIYSFKNEIPTNNIPKNIYDYKGDYLIPYSNSSYIDKSDINQYNKETLALMRNEIYARHGYIFGTEPYKSYFNSKSWYSPDSSFKGDDKELNEYEVSNVKTIKSVENSK